MSRLGGIFFFLLLVALFIEVVVGFPVELEQEPEKIEVAKEAPEIQDREQLVGDLHLVESREGERDWELFALKAKGSGGKGTWQLTKVKVQFYSKGKIDFTVDGDSGEIEYKAKDMTIKGNVVIRSANSYVFKSELMNYDAKERIINCPQSVRMLGPKDTQQGALTLDGGSLKAKVDEGSIVIEPKVKAIRSFSSGKSFSVNSGGVRLSKNNTSAEFYGQVSIEVDTMKIEGPRAKFEYSSANDVLKSVVIMDGVKVSDIDKYATANEVIFEPDENQFRLIGRPRVVQNQDEITGEQIIFTDGGKNIKVEGMRARVEGR